MMTMKLSSTPYNYSHHFNNLKWRTFKFLSWAKLLKRFMDWDEIFYGSDDAEYDIASVLLNFVASTVPKWRTFKLLS
jgi:hypothetical protein